MEKFKKAGFIPADILIPQNCDFTKWSVVACDQYTSEPDYWTRVKDYVGSSPSALNLVFPEIYLIEQNREKRIEKINKSMIQYYENGVFKTLYNSFIYVKRQISNGKTRHGLIGAIDLEAYDYHKGSKSMVRATEGTVLERIPPRVEIRKNAVLEFPHIMILIDDPNNKVFNAVDIQEKIYDFDLMENGGNIKGYRVNADEKIADAILSLIKEDNSLLYAVGDGNHSLATAKECWEIIKKGLSDNEKETHPARYALCEIVNIHDDSMDFEPIHRVIFDCDVDKLIDEFKRTHTFTDDGKKITFITNENEFDIFVKAEKGEIAVGILQDFLDNFLKNNDGTIDYIHGEDVTRCLAKQSNKNIGFLLPPMDKSELFPAVEKNGALPRKTFSIGHACEKRYYLEGRKIR